MNRGSNDAGLYWLVLLWDFSLIHAWDWGGLVLSILYESMDSFSRLFSSSWVVYAVGGTSFSCPFRISP